MKIFDSFCRFNHMNSLRDVPEHVLREISNFFEVSDDCQLVLFRGNARLQEDCSATVSMNVVSLRKEDIDVAFSEYNSCFMVVG